ncbi:MULTISPECIES: hypothetical protein [Neorhizobium]|uniref:hypothetical protein n=1 Tax=Neorhizobium TaxID=1525371 RepID=UPI001785EBF4|nr:MULTISPECIES: hypothetical protein [Neorhizobium]
MRNTAAHLACSDDADAFYDQTHGFAPWAFTPSQAYADFIEMPDCMYAVRQIVILLLVVLPAFFALAK